jgi:hypothetical protein
MDELSRRVIEKEEPQNGIKKEKKTNGRRPVRWNTSRCSFSLASLAIQKENLASHDLYVYILLSRASIPPLKRERKKKLYV